MRIAFLIHRLEGGGAERQAALLAEGLHRRGHAVHVLTFHPGGVYRPRLEAAGVPITHLDLASVWALPGALWRGRHLLKGFNPQILHGYLTTGNILATWLGILLPGIRVVWGIRGTDLALTALPGPLRLAMALEQVLRHAPHLIISNSEAGRRDLVARHFPASRIQVVANGIDTTMFQRDPAGGASMRAAWGLPLGARLVGVVGRLDPMKDHPTFLRALATVRTTHPNLQAVIVGSGTEAYQCRLQQLAADLGLADSVRWEPARGDLPQIYSALDLLCLPSSMGEGFSNVLAEALACGTPCVATRVGDANLLLEPNRLVEAGDAEALARAMALTLAEDPAMAASQGRSLIECHYSLEALATRTEAILQDLVP